MRLQVKNFLYLKNAALNITPLTVIAGGRLEHRLALTKLLFSLFRTDITWTELHEIFTKYLKTFRQDLTTLQELWQEVAHEFLVSISKLMTIHIERSLLTMFNASSLSELIHGEDDRAVIEITDDKHVNKMCIEIAHTGNLAVSLSYSRKLEDYLKVEVSRLPTGFLVRVYSEYIGRPYNYFLSLSDARNELNIINLLLFIIATLVLSMFDGYIPSYPDVILISYSRFQLGYRYYRDLIYTCYDRGFSALRQEFDRLSERFLKCEIEDLSLVVSVVENCVNPHSLFIVEEPCRGVPYRECIDLLLNLTMQDVNVISTFAYEPDVDYIRTSLSSCSELDRCDFAVSIHVLSDEGEVESIVEI